MDYRYVYDHQNQRVAKMNITGSKTKYYLKTGATVMAEYGTDTDLEAEYIYGPTGMIAKYSPSKGYIWYMKDHLGSTRELSSADYAYQTRRDYFPYGEAITSSGTETDYLFTGKELDNGTGLYYFGARYYAPGVGRWLAPDAAGQYSSPYVYCGNNPLITIDKDGNVGHLLIPGYTKFVRNQINKVRQHEAFQDPTSQRLLGVASAFNEAVPDAYTLGQEIEGRIGNIVEGIQEGNTTHVLENAPITGEAIGTYKTVKAAAQGDHFAQGQLMGGAAIAGAAYGATAKQTFGYHATTPEAASAIMETGFRSGVKPGRLGSSGVYVNSTAKGAIAEFSHHSPGIKPSVLKVQYNPGKNAMGITIPRKYVMSHPLNVNSISAQSVRAPGTINTNILNNSAKPLKILEP